MAPELVALLGNNLVLTVWSVVCRWGGDAITAPLPATLNLLLDAWVDKGHKLLARPGVATLFVNAKGLPHSRGSWSTAWREGFLQSGGSSAVFPYHRLRHIFVEDRLQNPGQVRRGAAEGWCCCLKGWCCCLKGWCCCLKGW